MIEDPDDALALCRAEVERLFAKANQYQGAYDDAIAQHQQEIAALRAEVERLKADPIKWNQQQTAVENDNDNLRARVAELKRAWANDANQYEARIAELEMALKPDTLKAAAYGEGLPERKSDCRPIDYTDNNPQWPKK